MTFFSVAPLNRLYYEEIFFFPHLSLSLRLYCYSKNIFSVSAPLEKNKFRALLKSH